jgi:hypothetical protein
MQRSRTVSRPVVLAALAACLRPSLGLLCLALAACSGGDAKAAGADFPGDDAGARRLVAALQSGTASFLPLLRPTDAELAVLFEADATAAVRAYVDPLYTEIKPAAVGAKEGQSELILTPGTSDDFRAGTGAAAEFPGGYKEHGAKFRPGVRWYRWQFVKPGETSGMAYDGLAHVQGRWVWIPKPWRAMR